MHKKQYIDLDFAKRGIDDFFASSPSRRMRFFGSGEPTVAFSQMQEITAHARAWNELLDIEIQTNAFFSHEVAEWLAANLNTIYVSADGDPSIQDVYRPTLGGGKTSDVVARNIRYFTSQPHLNVAVRMTIGNQNLYRQREMVQYFADLGVKHVWSRPIFPAPIGESKGEEESVNMMIYAKELAQAKIELEKKGLFYGSFLTCNFDQHTTHYCSAIRPCPVLTTDGYVTGCDNVLFGENAGIFDCFVYGKWDAESQIINYDQSKIEQLRTRVVDNIPGCSGCSAKNKCGGYCLAEILEHTGDFYGKKDSICGPTRYLAHTLPIVTKPFAIRHP